MKFRSAVGLDLDKLHRDLPTKLGREDEALERCMGVLSRASLQVPL